MESKKFFFDKIDFEVDGLLVTQDKVLLVESKSNIKKHELKDVKQTFERVRIYADRLGLDEEAVRLIRSDRMECVIFCETIPSDVLRELQQMKFTVHTVVNSGDGYDALDHVVGKRGKAFPSLISEIAAHRRLLSLPIHI